ncbi:ABC transporter permease [Mariniluteicoccus flavus]
MSTLRAETRRLLSTPAWWRFALAGLAIGLLLTGGITLLGPEHMNPPMPGPDSPDGVRGLLGLLVLAAPVPVVLGSRTMTNEYAHRTIVPTLLGHPHRLRLVTAKLVVHLLAGSAYGLLLATGAVVGTLGACAALGLTPGLPAGEVVTLSLRLGGSMALYTVIGVGIGALVANPQACLVIAVGWFYLLESMLSAVPGLARAYPWLPGGAASALTGQSFVLDAIMRTTSGTPPRLLPAWGGAAVLLAYAAVLAAAALVTTLRRDVR